MAIANCPSCGAPVRFRGAASIVAICEFCRSTLVRQGAALENIGKMAEVIEDASPLQLGTEGRYKGVHFALIGRIQYRYASGSWNEWYCTVRRPAHRLALRCYGELSHHLPQAARRSCRRSMRCSSAARAKLDGQALRGREHRARPRRRRRRASCRSRSARAGKASSSTCAATAEPSRPSTTARRRRSSSPASRSRSSRSSSRTCAMRKSGGAATAQAFAFQCPGLRRPAHEARQDDRGGRLRKLRRGGRRRQPRPRDHLARGGERRAVQAVDSARRARQARRRRVRGDRLHAPRDEGRTA